MPQRRTSHSNLISVRPRSGNTYISRSRTAFITDHAGQAHSENSAEGLYIYDTRVLSRYGWRIDGKKPEFSGGSPVEQFTWTAYLVQSPQNCKKTPSGECDPLQQTLELRLARSVGEGMHEDVFLTNHTQIETDLVLELQYEYAFVSQDEAESGRKQFGNLDVSLSEPRPGVWEQMADYHAEHRYDHQGNEGTARLHRGLQLRIENAGSAPKFANDSVQFHIHLAPHEQWHVCLSWLAYIDGNRQPLMTQCSLVDSGDWNRRRDRLLREATSFPFPPTETKASLVNRVLQRARVDMADLRMYLLDSPGGIALAAGVPTYMEVFGRDMQAASWQATVLSPEFLRGSLNVLVKLVAGETNDWRDAEPGRIPHQLHSDPLSALNFRPTGLYFGDITSSLLLPISVCELWRWTGDLDGIRPYVEPCMNALAWADKYSLDSTGFYRYKTHSTQGVKNQGWKDSDDAIVYPDGSQVDAPIGTCEMQAFAYAAKLHFSEVMWRLGHLGVARRLFREAGELKKRFNDKFWMEEEGFYAMGIDPKGELIRSIASDPGHCVLAGIVDESRVKQVTARLLKDDLFSGWGLRTLSASHPAFNPFSYHRGSVWPVTNASFIMGFSRYGLHGEMHQLAEAIFDAASLFEQDRLPEVFGGHQRDPDHPFPGMYMRADWPQAWSASAPFLIVQALLGIYPYAPGKILFVDPHLPAWLPEMTLEHLRIGKATVTLHFVRNAHGRTEYEIVDLNGVLRVVRQPSPWSLTTGWAERTRDIAESFGSHRQAS